MADRVDDAVGIGARSLDLPFRRLDLGDVGEGDDHPVDPVVLGAVGQDAADIPGAAFGLDLAPDRGEAGQHRAGIGEQIAVGGERGQIGKRPADIGGDDAEQRLCRRREEPDVELAVEEQRRDVRAVEDVLQIVRCAALPFERLLKLAVEGGELFIERLQLFLRGHQLLVGRLELLVDRHRLFVDRRLLLVGDLEVADRALQLLAGRLELPLELGDPRDVVRRLARPVRLRLARRVRRGS